MDNIVSHAIAFGSLLLGSVALQMTETTYARPIAIFWVWVILRPSRHPATSKKDSSLDA